MIEAGAVGHGRGDGDDALVFFGQIGERVGEDFGIGGRAVGGLAGLRIVGAEAVEFLLPVERGLKAAALLREHVQQDGVVEGLEKLEGLDQQRNVVAVDGAEVFQAELLKQDGGPEHALGGFFGAAHHFDGGLAAEALDEMRGAVVQVLVVLVGHDAVEVAGHGAHVAVDGPLVVVEHNDHAPGLLGDVVHRFKGDAVGEGGVAGDGDHVFVAAGQVAGHGHAQRGGERGACVAGAVAIVLAFGAQHEAVEAAGLADGLKPVAAAGENLVDVGLVADVEEDLVFGRVEDGMQGQRELDHAEIGAEMAAGFGESLDEEVANLLGKLGHLRGIEALYVGGRVDGLQQCSHVFPSPGKRRASRENPPAAKKPPGTGVFVLGPVNTTGADGVASENPARRSRARRLWRVHRRGRE